jgi:hypothetical protein
MIEIKAPNPVPFSFSNVFMAGSIEMGKADNWQTRFAAAVADMDITLVNPRRDDWDSSWKQEIGDPQFSEQVNWELDNIAKAAYVVFYFDPNTMSPITLMELGIASGDPAGVIVCCPHGFWRKGNVDIVCQRAGIPVVHSLDELIAAFREEVK